MKTAMEACDKDPYGCCSKYNIKKPIPPQYLKPSAGPLPPDADKWCSFDL